MVNNQHSIILNEMYYKKSKVLKFLESCFNNLIGYYKGMYYDMTLKSYYDKHKLKIINYINKRNKYTKFLYNKNNNVIEEELKYVKSIWNNKYILDTDNINNDLNAFLEILTFSINMIFGFNYTKIFLIDKNNIDFHTLLMPYTKTYIDPKIKDENRNIIFDIFKSTEVGLRINYKKYQINGYFLMSTQNFKENFTSGELLAIFLHEIFHNFNDKITNISLDNIIDEKLADKAPSIFGYGKEAVSFQLKLICNYILKIYYEKKLIYKSKKDIINSTINEIINHFKNILLQYSLDSNFKTHPSFYFRILTNIYQLESELKNPNISKNKKIQISHDIEKIRETIIANDLGYSKEEKEVIDYTLYIVFNQEIIIDLYLNLEDAKKNKMYTKEFTDNIDSIHNKTKNKESIYGDYYEIT